MIARIQQAIVLAQLSAALIWFGLQTRAGAWIAAVVGAALLANVQAVILAVEFFVLLPLAQRGEGAAAPRPSVWQLLRAWWRETVTGHSVFGWQQPFRSHRYPDRLDATARGRRAVVLVHGFFCNRGLWNRWMPRLQAEGVPFVTVTLEPAFGSIDRYTAVVDGAIARATEATGLAPVVVGHSMGGLAIRAWWRAAGSAGDARVHSAITIATPHRGTLAACFAQGRNARQMRPRSGWLADLERSEPAQRRARFTCFWSHCDNIALPASTATLPGADNRHIAGQPHVALAFDAAVIDEVLRRVSPGSA